MNSDPLARIMYGSRELFHSNLLAWLLETFPELSRIFDTVDAQGLPDDDSPTKPIVRREWMNMDLFIERKQGPSLAIENKVFSLPRTDQLEKYSKRLSGQKDLEVRGVLLTLSDPGWDTYYCEQGAILWDRLTYRQLADRIETSLPNECPGKRYELDTARRYVVLIRRLQELVDLVKIEDDGEPVFLVNGLPASVDRQFVNAIAKLRAQMVISDLERRLPESTLRRTTGAGLSNGSPVIDMGYRKTEKPTAHLYGWQLQGTQFRLCAVLPDQSGRTEESRKRRVQWGFEHEALFDFSKLIPLIGGPRTVKPESFNRFDPDFIYRYILAPDLTVGQLAAVAQQRQLDVEEAMLQGG